MTARSRELFGLIPVSLLVAAGFAAVLATRSEDVSDATLTYGAVFLGLCVLAHLFIRARLPDADPFMFPISALLAAVASSLPSYRVQHVARNVEAIRAGRDAVTHGLVPAWSEVAA